MQLTQIYFPSLTAGIFANDDNNNPSVDPLVMQINIHNNVHIDKFPAMFVYNKNVETDFHNVIFAILIVLQ